MYRYLLQSRSRTERNHARALLSTLWGKLTVISAVCVIGYLIAVTAFLISWEFGGTAAKSITAAVTIVCGAGTLLHPYFVYCLNRRLMMWWVSRIAVAGLPVVGLAIILAGSNSVSAAVVGAIVGVWVVMVCMGLFSFGVYIYRHGFGPRPRSPMTVWRNRLHIKGAKMTVAAVRNPSPQRYARLRDGVADWAPEGDSPRVPIHPIIKAEREAYGTPAIVTLYVLYRLWRDGRIKISRHGLILSESEWTNQQIK